jgi:hypothetical protein
VGLLGVPAMNRVVLDYAQEIEAHQVGFARVAALKGRPDHPGRFNKGISLHEFIGENAEAVGAEMAVAQFFGLRNFKPTLNTFKNEADVGARLEVKWTKYDNGSLIINKTDRQQDVAVLVTGRSPVYQLSGWIPVSMARQAIFHHRLQDNYWVTQRDLFPITDLRRSSYGNSID